MNNLPKATTKEKTSAERPRRMPPQYFWHWLVHPRVTSLSPKKKKSQTLQTKSFKLMICGTRYLKPLPKEVSLKFGCFNLRASLTQDFFFKEGVPNLWDLMADDLGGADITMIETKWAINVMCSNHPETISPPPSLTPALVLVFLKTGPWCQKGWRPFF